MMEKKYVWQGIEPMLGACSIWQAKHEKKREFPSCYEANRHPIMMKFISWLRYSKIY